MLRTQLLDTKHLWIVTLLSSDKSAAEGLRHSFESLDHAGIEMRSLAADDELASLLVRDRCAVQLPGRCGVVHVDDRHHASGNWNLCAAQAPWIARAVPALVMGVNDLFGQLERRIIPHACLLLGLEDHVSTEGR